VKEATHFVKVGTDIGARATNGASIVTSIPCVITDGVHTRLAVVERVDGLAFGAHAKVVGGSSVAPSLLLVLLRRVETRGVFFIEVFLTDSHCLFRRNGNRPRRFISITQTDIATTRTADRNLSECHNESAHELGSPTSAKTFVGPVTLMTNFNAELQFVHLSNANNLDLNLRMEVTAVERVANKGEQLLLQSINIFKRCVPGGEDRHLLPHSLASGNVLNPQVVKDNVGCLNDFTVINTLEDGVEKGDVLHGEQVSANVDAVSNVVRMFDEQEDAGTENFLAGGSEYEGERQQSSSGRSQGGSKAGTEEADCVELVYRRQ
jgi:hypothetical protein